MNPRKLDKILNYFREEMSVANAPGTQGGFSNSASDKGPVAGYDKPMKPLRKRYIWTKGIRKNWKPERQVPNNILGKKGES
tara:strand:+ start:392 stop:634 length:243 start_codon:yes stop_codon:yes gene_type:complete